MKIAPFLLLKCFNFGVVFGGQLAITEAMSSPSTMGPNGPMIPMSDYWELTNFGSTPVDLTGYQWNDGNGGLSGADKLPFEGLAIQPGESILFVQSGAVATEQDVRTWWGDGISSSTRIVFYNGNGFGQAGDAIRLWGPGETNPLNVAAEVVFQESRNGVSFVYDPQTGEFGRRSQLGDPGVVRAATRDDIGSPGRTSGSVPLTVLTQPDDRQVCAGDDVMIDVEVRAVPAPTFQWHWDEGVIPGATRSRLTISNVTEAKAGRYWVEVRSGELLQESRKCLLSMDQTPRSPSFTRPLMNPGGLVGETAILRAEICGYPEPELQWFRDGTLLEGETGRTLTLPSLTLEQSGMEYCLEATNPLGTARNCMALMVQSTPNLAITEVAPSETVGCAQAVDWFEITNFDTREVSILGYQWISLNGLPPILESPIRVESDIRLRPGQSAVLVERLTPTEFRQWWGAERLPPDLQIGTFKSQGLSQFGDTIYLWGPGATDPNAPITSASWAGASPGVSLEFEGVGPGALDVASVVGRNGAFQSAGCDDVGSPGFIANPAPRILLLRQEAAGWILRWRSVKGQSYTVHGCESLEKAVWHRLQDVVAADWVSETLLPLGETSMYFRLETP